MTNDEGMTKPALHHCHPERSRRIPWNYLKAFATGFLDFARNDEHLIRHLSFGFHSLFIIRQWSFM
jgi:hypothetical protein